MSSSQSNKLVFAMDGGTLVVDLAEFEHDHVGGDMYSIKNKNAPLAVFPCRADKAARYQRQIRNALTLRFSSAPPLRAKKAKAGSDKDKDKAAKKDKDKAVKSKDKDSSKEKKRHENGDANGDGANAGKKKRAKKEKADEVEASASASGSGSEDDPDVDADADADADSNPERVVAHRSGAE